MHGRRSLLLRWSWRDLRARWVQVAAIALILSIGTAVFAALGSTAVWRRASNDASFAATNLHDLEARLTTGTSTDAGQLAALVAELPGQPAAIAEERLVWPIQAEVRGPDAAALVSGEIVGAETDARINIVAVRKGEPVSEGSTVLEYRFARSRELTVSGTVELGGGQVVPYGGHGTAPEYFYVMPPSGQLAAPGNIITVFASLTDAQRAVGQQARVNDVVLDLRSGVDVDSVAADLEAALSAAGLAAEVTRGDEEPAYQLLYDDIEGDQAVWNMISFLVLLGASFAAFNLVGRIVESQRREIGIGMAMGERRRRLAVRPLLVGLQIALIGVVAGVAVGFGLGALMKSVMDYALPLPVWVTEFQASKYAQAVAIGLVLPFAATALPVWRAVRVQPVDAIRTGHVATGSSGWARAVRRITWPRSSLGQMPLRNLLRRPRRTLLTTLAVATSIVVLVGVFGMLDSFRRTIRTSDTELSGDAPDRLDVQLATFVPEAQVMAVADPMPEVAAVSPTIIVPSTASTPGHEEIDLALEVIDFVTAPWSPRVSTGDVPGGDGVLLASKAAEDLGVGVGDTVEVRHPRRDGTGHSLVTSKLRVSGLHAIPARGFAYLDRSQAELLGLSGLANRVQVMPAPGSETIDVQRALRDQPMVVSAVPVGDATDAFDEALRQFGGILRALQAIVLGLALLVAFNSASIAADERAREHATMFAFGVRVRSVLAISMAESAVIGLLSTIVGAVAGFLVLRWMLGSLLARTLPEIGIPAYLSPSTLVTVVILGVVVVALAPLFTIRKLRRVDIPATLRVVE